MVSTRADRRKIVMIMEENSSTAQKYSRRRLEEVPVQFAPTPSRGSFVGSLQKIHGHPSSLRAATRILNPKLVANSGIKIQEWQHCTSDPTVKPHIDCGIPKKDFKPTVATGSPNWAGHGDNEHSHHHRLDVPRVTPSQEPQKSELPFPQPASDHQSRENVVPEKNTTSHVTTSLINITEFAKRLQDGDDDDPDEVQSVLNPAFDYVDGRKVKKEHVTLVRAIFKKYGDITWECVGKPAAIVSFFLERVCIIYEKLKETKFSDATIRDLNEMLNEVKFLESEKLNLGWLHQKLQHICETKTKFQSYLTFKEEEKRSEAIIATLENELEANNRQRRLLEDKLADEMAKFDKINNEVRDIKVMVDHLWRHSLVDGFL